MIGMDLFLDYYSKLPNQDKCISPSYRDPCGMFHYAGYGDPSFYCVKTEPVYEGYGFPCSELSVNDDIL